MTQPPQDETQIPVDDEGGDLEDRRYPSVDRALTDHGIPTENHAFIREFTSAIGIAAYYGRSGYIKAVREGDGPALNIAPGWSNGFVSEEEASAATGGNTKHWASGRGTGLWGVDHPRFGPGGGSGRSSKEKREWGHCPKCGYARLPTGDCAYCEG